MPVITSHVLDAVAGVSAIGFRVQLLRLVSDTERQLVFDIESDAEGRICEQVALSDDSDEEEFELVFFSQEYFENQGDVPPVKQNMKTMVARFTMQERSQRYHIPLVLSPHAYTIWWSE